MSSEKKAWSKGEAEARLGALEICPQCSTIYAKKLLRSKEFRNSLQCVKFHFEDDLKK